MTRFYIFVDKAMIGQHDYPFVVAYLDGHDHPTVIARGEPSRDMINGLFQGGLVPSIQGSRDGIPIHDGGETWLLHAWVQFDR